ncbi:MAG: hypothetical protein JXB60_04225 [Candidatus Cloacimonetes bacterium]|nr:hypothetical protein [Candidatus Cloacimonadota bacterium]
MDEPVLKYFEQLHQKFISLGVLRPYKYFRYLPGSILNYDLKTFGAGENTLRITLQVTDFVGGGFAGQVYQVKLLKHNSNNPSSLLQINNSYALKILIPPTFLARLFRNLLYRIGFQAPFQLQVNPAAARAGALWQKFIHRAARIRFGSDKYVTDILGTLIDHDLGSCGELLEWIDGRTWRLEADDRINFLSGSLKTDKKDLWEKYSPEFKAKFRFMHALVDLLHEIGASEIARQYEWSTMKSQPNCLKRNSTNDDPASGLVAVDFRAGLALLPFLPMSPGDFSIIIRGILRGSIVQFDRGNLKKLATFMDKHPQDFADMAALRSELQEQEAEYRNSQIDITHNHIRVFHSRCLWRVILVNSIRSWQITGICDKTAGDKLQKTMFLTFLLFLAGFIPLLGKALIKFSCNSLQREHLWKMASSFHYLRLTWKANLLQNLSHWLISRRIKPQQIAGIESKVIAYFIHCLLSVLPTSIHRFLTDSFYFRQRLHHIFIRPLQLYFNSSLREKWLRDMLADGIRKNMLTRHDAMTIESHIDEPFIQKYLKSLAVHVCTIPITQIVSVMLAILYTAAHPELPPAQAWAIGLSIIALFQVIPISPGSLARGLYVVYLVIKERDFRNYNIAVFLSFFKYIGYLAFPIQMTYRYPALARFMAGHWATEAVHMIPVFGEKGALLEHWIFRLFYNWPLTIRRQMQERKAWRRNIPPRIWHAPFILILGSFLMGVIEYLWQQHHLVLPQLKDIWWALVILPCLAGSLLTRFAGGMIIWQRLLLSLSGGLVMTVLVSFIEQYLNNDEFMIYRSIWLLFFFCIFSVWGSIFTELTLGETGHKNESR